MEEGDTLPSSVALLNGGDDMAEEINATCSICGKGYHKCLGCKTQMKSAPWKMYTDTSEHYKIFQVIHGFDSKVYTKEEAKEKLQNIDLSDLEEFRDHIRKIIMDIMKEDAKAQKAEKQVEELPEQVIAKSDERSSFMSRKKKQSGFVKSDEVVGE